MDWWFDIDNRICRVEMETGIFRKPTITFEGDLSGVLSERKIFKSGCTYIYEVEPNHKVSINDVVYRGERYVSLYVDRRLIKEYSVNAQAYSAKYMASPQLYDKPVNFIKRALKLSLLESFYGALSMLVILALLNSVSSYKIFFVLLLGLAAGLYAAIFCLHLFVYSHQRSMMARYAIISSIKRRKKINKSGAYRNKRR